MDNSNKIVQSLWIGARLTVMERLCINSFIKNGHEFHLYVYGPVLNVPEGVVIRDAQAIIPEDEIFTLRGGYSSFSDFFRWKLILDRGGWWVDLDAVCLKPFDFKEDYVFFGGLGPPGSNDCVTSGLFKAYRDARVMLWGWNMTKELDPATMPWGQAGPPLFTEAVHTFFLHSMIVPGQLVFPVFYTEAPEAFIRPDPPVIPADCYSIHLFNEVWRLASQDKNATYPKTSLYEQLKEKYL